MTQRILPADVYDALEFSALAFDGFGAGQFAEYDDSGAAVCPCCLIGHARFLDGTFLDGTRLRAPGEAEKALEEAEIRWSANDSAVTEWRYATKQSGARMPFDDLCKALNVVRGR